MQYQNSIIEDKVPLVILVSKIWECNRSDVLYGDFSKSKSAVKTKMTVNV